ncbi:X-linked interleukin-1 receptor accessory protein-like 2 [Geospiza fortis]|uniref:X-linked interleukin-1 receptor accessory protein-like 2 n=1 Tax=Geospiza fortis TaxID=48883 RepID=A0A8N5EMR8_GEOFO|nr:X-linked interleukin-1 receptor accessory protein-like 2 [Geospiza fortis]
MCQVSLCRKRDLCRYATKQLPQLFSPHSLLLVHPNSSALVLLDTTEAVFDFIQRSRRMIVVLSPDYLTEKSISLLEFKLGIMCQNAIATKLIVVEYRPLQCTHPSILQLKESVSFVTWKGEKSKRSGSQFWKALRWDSHLCNPGSGRPPAQGPQGRGRAEPPPAQGPALALCHYSDLSNNNDFYVL